MSVLVEYFVAPDDEKAARTIDWVGGPGAGAPAGRWGRRAGGGYPTVDGSDIDPFIRLAMFEELLTGRSYDDQQQDESSRPVVADRDGGERLVVRIDDAFVAALAGATDPELERLAEPWARIEEFHGAIAPAILVAFAQRLRALAQRAGATNGGVFCWVCV